MNTSSTQKTKTESAPWQVQQPYLTDAFSKAQSLSNNQYTGDRVAQFTPDQLSTFQKMVGYGGSNSLPGMTGDVGAGLTSAGLGATQGALSRLGAFTPQGGTSSNIDAANAYADAAATPAAVDAAMRDARRQVSEQALPQVARSSALSGNPLSSRRAITEGIIERGLAEKGADVSAQMRSSAFNSGLNLAEQGRQSDTNAMLDAIKSGGALGAGASATGVDAFGKSIAQQGSLFDMANTGGAGQQASAQAALDNSIAKSESPWDSLMKYYSIVGGQNWGGTQTGESSSTPSMWQVIGGLMSAGGSLAGGFTKSDRNAKHDIKRIGKLDNGLPVYSFKYNHLTDSPTFIGLMAQDVELVKPEAVMTVHNVKHVNYELATQPE